jgi:ribosomal-protein-alanine N-acetyltransferase
MTERPGRFFIRKMRTEDLPEVQAIEIVSFPNPWSEDTFRGEIQNTVVSEPLVVVHRPDGRVVGYTVYWRIGDDVQVNNIAIHPDFRGRGIGESLMKFILEKVRGAGVTFVSLEVRASNIAALTLYGKLGFEVLGTRKGYYTNPSEDALVMGLVLGQ